MPLLQIVRACGSATVIGLVGFVIGCSGGGGTAPALEKGAAKENAREVMTDRKESRQARKQAKTQLRSSLEATSQPKEQQEKKGSGPQ
jgi:hypothetical protein